MKLNQIKLELSKILASFSELKTDKAILTWPSDEEARIGLEVYVLDENGEYTEAPDGEYVDEEERIIVVKEGRIESITTKTEEPEETVEETVEEIVEAEETEETPTEETVESPSGEEEPIPDAVEELRKEVNELFEIIHQLIGKVSELESRIGESDERIEKMSKMSAANPAEVEIETATTVKTNNKKFEAALEGIKAARNL